MNINYIKNGVKKFFNKKNCFFSFLFYLPFEIIQELEKDEKENYMKFVINQLNEFSKKCNDKRNLMTYIIKTSKDIFENNNNINNNFIKTFIDPLISINDQNVQIQIFPVKFSIDKNYKIINDIEKFKNDFIEYDERNYEKEEIFAKKELIEFKYLIPKNNNEENKTIKLKVGKIISLPLKSNLSDFIKNDFKIQKDKLNLQLLEIIFEPNLPTETILTDVGTQIDIYEFIKLCINPTFQQIQIQL